MKRTLRICFSLAILGVIYMVHGNNGGPSWGYTSAPSDATCQSCHTSFSLQTSGTLHDKIELRMNTFVGGGYLPDSTYEFLLVFLDTSRSKAGFQLTALDNSNNPAGTFATVDSRTQIGSKSVGGKTRRYIGHTGGGTSHQGTDSISWRIKWTAPSSNIGEVKFYLNTISANGNGNNSNDYVFSKEFTASPSSLLPTAKVKLVTSKPCRRVDLKFEATVTGSPTKYDWSFPGGSPNASSATSPIIQYLGAGTKTIYLTPTNSYGTGKTDTFELQVLNGPARPVIQESVGGVAEKCRLENIALTVIVQSNETYVWFPDSIVTDTLVVSNIGQYIARAVNNTTGCFLEGSPVFVNDHDSTYFTINKGSKDTLCSGVDSIRFSIESGSDISESFVLDGSDTVALNTNKIVLSPNNGTSNKTFMIYARDSINCAMSTQSVTYSFKEQEDPPILTSNTGRTLKEIQLNWNTVPKAIAYEISINGNSYFPSNSGGSDTFYKVTGLSPGSVFTYKIRSVILSHCLNSKDANGKDSLLSCPSLSFDVLSDTNYCEGDTAKISIGNVSVTNHELYVYGNQSSNNMAFVLANKRSQEVEVYILDSTGLCRSDTTKVTVLYDSIDSHILENAYLPICMDNSSTLEIQFGLNPATSNGYAWFVNGIQKAVGPSRVQKLTVGNGDEIYAMASKGACSSITDTAIIAFSPVLDCKIVATRKTDDNYTIKTSESGKTHVWSINGIVQAQQGDSFDYNFSSLAGTTAKINSSINLGANCNCQDSLNLDLTILSILNVQRNHYSVFPNPASDFVKAASKLIAVKVPYQILSANGSIVKQGFIDGVETYIKTNDLSNGLYQLRLGKSQSHIFKIAIFH